MNLELFLLVLPHALKGWLAIFVVTLVIVGCITLLNKTGAPKKDKTKSMEQN